jgi:acyl-coenzyme A synthetase/AMP-(fatty) acid ligase
MGGQTSSMEHNTHFQRPVYKDLLSFALEEQPVAYDEQRPLYVDAENPGLSLNVRQVRVFVRTVIAGLKRRAGVEAGDCVLVTLPNNVSLSFVLCLYP